MRRESRVSLHVDSLKLDFSPRKIIEEVSPNEKQVLECVDKDGKSSGTGNRRLIDADRTDLSLNVRYDQSRMKGPAIQTSLHD